MTPEQIKQFIQGGEWVSITTELRPSTINQQQGTSSRFIVREFLPIPLATVLPVP